MKKRHLCLLLCMFMLAYCIYTAPIRVERREPNDQTHLIFSDEDGNIIKEIAVARYVVCSPSKNYAMVVQFPNPPEPPYPYGGWWDPPATQPEPVQQESKTEIAEIEDVVSKSAYSSPTSEDLQARPAWEEWKQQITTVTVAVYDSTGNITETWEAPRTERFTKFPGQDSRYLINSKGIVVVAGYQKPVLPYYYTVDPVWDIKALIVLYNSSGEELYNHLFPFSSIKFAGFTSNDQFAFLLWRSNWDMVPSKKQLRHELFLFDKDSRKLSTYVVEGFPTSPTYRSLSITDMNTIKVKTYNGKNYESKLSESANE